MGKVLVVNTTLVKSIIKNNMPPFQQKRIESAKERFEEECGFWFPPGVDALTPDGDSRSMKTRLMDFLESELLKEADSVRGECMEEVADLATGVGCLKEKWKCCGYHDACEDVMKRLEALSFPQKEGKCTCPARSDGEVDPNCIVHYENKEEK